MLAGFEKDINVNTSIWGLRIAIKGNYGQNYEQIQIKFNLSKFEMSLI